MILAPKFALNIHRQAQAAVINPQREKEREGAQPSPGTSDNNKATTTMGDSIYE